MKINKKRVIPFIFAVLGIIAELPPYSAVLNFANPDGEPFRATYSYFNPITYGYANFAPFLTALTSCVLLGIATAYIFRGSKSLRLALTAFAGAAFALSLISLLCGNITVLAVVISALFALSFAFSFLVKE